VKYIGNFKKIPKFKSLKQEKDFWEKNDSADYIDWSQAKHAVFPNLKPSTKTISLRLPENLLNDIKSLANKDDVPYQSLMKLMLAQGLKEAHRK
jgi:predicted DNA binding CopG/RHH family protein